MVFNHKLLMCQIDHIKWQDCFVLVKFFMTETKKDFTWFNHFYEFWIADTPVSYLGQWQVVAGFKKRRKKAKSETQWSTLAVTQIWIKWHRFWIKRDKVLNWWTNVNTLDKNVCSMCLDSYDNIVPEIIFFQHLTF